MRRLVHKVKKWKSSLLHTVEKAKTVLLFTKDFSKILKDFSLFLHHLRTNEVPNMPPGAKVFLSAGCAGSWYFEWITEHYGPLDKHIGVECYTPKPPELPPGVEWVSNSVSQMINVPDGSVDLVFSGQNIEHLWPEETAGFLIEANRVLNVGGWIVMDSPNRKVTEALLWSHPEHVVEFRVSEIVELLTLAGFEDIRTKGIWICYDKLGGKPLPLAPMNVSAQWPLLRRVQAAHHCPDDSFLWWVEARKSERQPDEQAIRRRVAEIFEIAWPERIQRLQTIVGATTVRQGMKVVASDLGEPGVLIYGPYMPLRPGKYNVSFQLSADATGLEQDAIICICDVLSSRSEAAISSKSLSASQLGNEFSDVELDFELKELHFGVQFRVIATGAAAVSAVFKVKLSEKDSGDGSWKPLACSMPTTLA